jgi:hypothetical protein
MMRLDEQGDRVPTLTGMQSELFLFLQSRLEVVVAAKTAGSGPFSCHVTVENTRVPPKGE